MELFRREKPFFAKCRDLDPEVLVAYGGKAGGQNTEESRLTLHASAGNCVAVFGDVHANLEALNAVLKDAKQQGVAQFACTGDLVGYGPNPSECLEIVKALDSPIVKGNHDEYSATDISLKDFTLHAMNALIWTRGQLSPEERVWLNSLPMQSEVLTTKETENTEIGLAAKERRERESKSENTNHVSIVTPHLVHSSVFEPERWRYIIKQEEAEKVLPVQKPDLVFFGHTHVPSAYAFHPDTGEFKSTVPSPEGTLELEPEWKWLVNPGSVGQPRDKDPRAAYLIFDPVARTIEQRRVEYDFKKTARKIVEAGLPERNAQRLYKGR